MEEATVIGEGSNRCSIFVSKLTSSWISSGLPQAYNVTRMNTLCIRRAPSEFEGRAMIEGEWAGRLIART